MFVGHAAVALAVKRRAPSVSLGWLFGAAFALDLVWPFFLLLGLERVRVQPGATAFTPLVFEHYPWSHSLMLAVVWGIAATELALACGVERTGARWLAPLVISHWLLDLVSHAPDLPLRPGATPLVGFGLWNSVPATLAVEGTLLVAGLAVYLRATRARDRAGSLGLWALVLTCAAMWAGGPWAPPPPSATALAWFSLGLWLFVAWAAWADGHRAPRAA